MDCSQKRVLSIQSHVVSGYVGNKASVFPLQVLGFDVDFINSVNFSNHTGYQNGFEGDVLGGDQLRNILNGLERNGLLQGIGHLLTGYIGSESFLRAVLDVLKKLRSVNSESHPVRYVCDPVLGDQDWLGNNSRFYCPKELVEIYRTLLIPLADVLTPNQFEVEQLTKVKVKTIADAKRACNILHSMGPELVFITSVVLDDSDQDVSTGSRQMTILASKREGNGTPEMWRVDSSIISGRYTGTGDLCAAILLAWTAKEPGNLSSAMEKVCGSMWSIIKETENKANDSVSSRELRLIQSKDVLENPPSLFEARRIL